MCCHPAITLSCLCVRNEATTGGQFTKLDRPTDLLFLNFFCVCHAYAEDTQLFIDNLGVIMGPLFSCCKASFMQALSLSISKWRFRCLLLHCRQMGHIACSRTSLSATILGASTTSSGISKGTSAPSTLPTWKASSMYCISATTSVFLMCLPNYGIGQLGLRKSHRSA